MTLTWAPPGVVSARHRGPYDLLFGQRKAPDRTPLSKPPDGGRKIAER